MFTINSFSANIPYLNLSSTNWATFSEHFWEAMQVMGQWGHFDGTKPYPVPKRANALGLACGGA